MADWNPTANEFFLNAIEIGDPQQRRVYLDSACAGDAGLRQAVDALLQAHAEAGSFLDRPGDATIAPSGDESAAATSLEKPGTIIAGRYKLLQQIGEGGMGTVWMAEQLEPVRRQVALKVIKPGMDSGQVLARFEAERQALALMDHPNIARVLDAGTAESGRPYFVMELVKGILITKYCDEKRLTLRQRLELMIPVCQAIQHAHQKGIIHRDIKPSNVLIALYDGKPVPKVIDFGVAKAIGQHLTEQTLFTSYGSIVGTLEYMSPEQAELNQLDVDTRSDIYSLGVLLYELVTGTTPLDRKQLKGGALFEILRLIREVEPPKPSTRLSTAEAAATLTAERQTELAQMTKLVRGEVDWIVMKALDKDRNRRYETANSMAEDLQRFLADEPVRAGPPSAGYRLRKFIKRNRGGVLAAATVLLVLVAGMVGTTWGMVWALDAEAQVRQWYEEATLKTAEAQTQQKRAVLAEADAREQERIAKAEAAEAKRSALAETAAKEQAEKKERLANYQALRAETTRHAIVIDQAKRAWEGEDIAEAHRVLATVAEPFRKTWETRYLAELCRRKARPWSTNLPVVLSELAFVGNIPHIVIVTRSGAIHMWDSARGELKDSSRSVSMASIKLPTTPPFKIAVSNDGRFFAEAENSPAKVVSADIRIWEAKTSPDKTPFRILKGLKAPVANLAFSPDGKSILADAYLNNRKMVRVWDIASGQEKLAFDAESVIWTPDGRLLYVAPEGGLWTRNFATGEATNLIKNVLENLVYGMRVGPNINRIKLAISNDGKRVVTSSRQALKVKVWDTVAGKELRSFTLESSLGLGYDKIGAVAISGNGRWIAMSNEYNKTTKVWDLDSGQMRASIQDAGVTFLAVSDDGNYLLTKNYNWPGRLWDLTAGPESLIMNIGRSVPLTVDRKGEHIISLCGGAGEMEWAIWDGKTGTKKLTIRRPNPPPGGTMGYPEAQPSGLAIDPDGQTLYLADAGPLRAWDMKTGKEKYQCTGDDRYMNCLAVAGDGRRAFSGGDDGVVRVWDLVNRRQEFAFDAHKSRGQIESISVSGDGKLLAVAGGRYGESPTFQVLDANTGQELLVVAANKSRVTSTAFSPDGKFLVSGGWHHNDEPLKVWEMPSGRLKFELKGHTNIVSSVAVTPDNQRIISASDDGTVRLWDVATGQEMLVLKLKGSYTRVAVSGDGRRIVANSGDGFRVWDSP